MVAVPANGTADMEHEFRHEVEHGAHLVAGDLGGVIVTGVDGENLVVLGRIGGVEVVAAHGEALESDAEHLALDAVLHVLLLLGEDLVEGVLEE